MLLKIVRSFVVNNIYYIFVLHIQETESLVRFIDVLHHPQGFFLFCSIYLFHSVFMYFLFLLLVCWIDTNRLPLFFSNNVMWNVNIYQYLKTMAMHTVFGWFILWSEQKVSHQPFHIMYLYQHSTFIVSASKVCLLAFLVFNMCIHMCIWYWILFAIPFSGWVVQLYT